MASIQLEVVSKQRSAPTPAEKDSLINEWLTRFALNAGTALGAKERAVYLTMWKEDFADVEAERLQAAFVACIRSHTFKTMPTIGDVRQHLSKAEENATEQAAEKTWQHVLDIRRTRWSPDAPSGFYGGRPTLSERVWHACRASGVFQDFESVEGLHTWAKKRFIESFVAWGEPEQDKFLLPDGEVKKLLAEFSETKTLPAPSVSFEELHKRGLEYAEELKSKPSQQPDIKRALRAVAGELAPRPPVRSLDEQKRILRERGLLP